MPPTQAATPSQTPRRLLKHPNEALHGEANQDEKEGREEESGWDREQRQEGRKRGRSLEGRCDRMNERTEKGYSKEQGRKGQREKKKEGKRKQIKE